MKTTFVVLTLNEIKGMKTLMPTIPREWFDRYLRDKQPWPSLEPHGN